MNNAIKIVFLTTFALVCAMACTERIEISTKDAASRLCIYGYIQNVEGWPEVRITKTVGYFSKDLDQPVSDAYVTLSDGENVHVLEDHFGEGTYWCSELITGYPGREYTLTVEVDSDGDGVVEKYTAVSVMPEPVEISDLQLVESEILSKRIEVQVWAMLPDNNGTKESNFYSFHISRGGMVIDDSLSKFRIIDGRYIDGNEMKGFPCYYLAQDKDESTLRPGEMVSLKIDVLPREYGKFLEDAQQEVSGSFPIFSGPPANVDSNIRLVDGTTVYPPPVGFFAAYCTTEFMTIYFP